MTCALLEGAWGYFSVEAVTDFFFFSWAPKSLGTVTAVMQLKDACSLEEKAMRNLDSILKNSDDAFPTIVKTMVFSVVTFGCDSWTKKMLSAEELMLSHCGAREDS